MTPPPIVRYMILCEDWSAESERPLRANVFGLLSTVTSFEEPSYPLRYSELCVFLALTEVRGVAAMRIVCVSEDTGEPVFGTPTRTSTFANEPLDIVAVVFRIRNCVFPHEGIYSFQFWYNDRMVGQRPLRLR